MAFNPGQNMFVNAASAWLLPAPPLISQFIKGSCRPMIYLPSAALVPLWLVVYIWGSCSADSPPLLLYPSLFCFMLSGINLFMDTFAFRLSRVSCWETGHLQWGPHTLCMWTKALGCADCTLAVWFANVAQQGGSEAQGGKTQSFRFQNSWFE